MLEHIHTHRNLIGFDENGIPVVIQKASAHDPEKIDAAYRAVEEGKNPEIGHQHGQGSHTHSHAQNAEQAENNQHTIDQHTADVCPEDEDEDAFIRDYMNAVTAYRKTFPSKQDQIEQTPDPAVREMLLRSEQLGIDTTFDRFDKQQPQRII